MAKKITIGQLVVDLLADTARFESDMKRAARSLGKTGADLTSAGKSLTAGITLPLAGIGIAAVKVAGDFEQTQIAFGTLLGSATKAGNYLKELADFAKKTPFEFSDLVDASKRMLALGFSSTQIIPTLRTIGDAVAGLGGGKEMIDRVVLALGQMQAKGKVSAQEMNQLAESGIPAWKLLADKIGVSIPEAMKMAEKGAISSAVAVPAILEGMNQKFAGLMDKQSQTLLGQFSNLKDQLFFIFKDIGVALMPLLKSIVDFANQAIPVVKGVIDAFSSMPQGTQFAIIAIAGVAAAAGPLLMAIGSIATGIATLMPFIGALVAILSGPVGWVAALVAVGTAVTTFVLTHKEQFGSLVTDLRFWFEDLKGFLIDCWGIILNQGKEIWGTLKEYFGEIGQEIAAFWKAHGEEIKLVLGLAWDNIKNTVKGVLEIIGGVIKGALEVIAGIMKVAMGLLKGDWKLAWEGVKDIVKGVVDAIAGIIKGGFSIITGTARDTTDRIKNYFKDMYEAIVGHSFVPDMVKGIQQHFSFLPSIMGDPTRSATGSVIDSFTGMFSNILNMAKNWKQTLTSLLSGLADSLLGSLFGGKGGLSQGLSQFTSGFGGLGVLGKLFAQKSPTGELLGGGGVGLGMPGWLTGFLTNPWTAAIGGALGGGVLLWKLLSHNTWEKGSIEAEKNLGVSGVTDDVIKEFVQGLGLKDKSFTPIRQDILTAPRWLQDVIVPFAQATGQIDQLIAKFSSIGAFGQYYDFSSSIKAAIAGDWEAYNKQWIELFGKSQALSANLPNWAQILAAAVTPKSETLSEGPDVVERSGSQDLGDFSESGFSSSPNVAVAVINIQSGATTLTEQDVRDKIVPPITTVLQNNTRGTTKDWADALAQALVPAIKRALEGTT